MSSITTVTEKYCKNKVQVITVGDKASIGVAVDLFVLHVYNIISHIGLAACLQCPMPWYRSPTEFSMSPKIAIYNYN